MAEEPFDKYKKERAKLADAFIKLSDTILSADAQKAEWKKIADVALSNASAASASKTEAARYLDGLDNLGLAMDNLTRRAFAAGWDAQPGSAAEKMKMAMDKIYGSYPTAPKEYDPNTGETREFIVAPHSAKDYNKNFSRFTKKIGEALTKTNGYESSNGSMVFYDGQPRTAQPARPNSDWPFVQLQALHGITTSQPDNARMEWVGQGNTVRANPPNPNWLMNRP